jgi:hypothetical protein
MPAMYMGRGGLDGLFSPKPPSSVGPVNAGQFNSGGLPMPGPAQSGGSVSPITTPMSDPSAAPAPTGQPNVLGAQSIRATGDPKGYDPSYLQNLATSIGALFARPQGNMNFNPLGNLSEVSPPSGQMGNAPGFGEPLTWLQQALNGLGFSWALPTPAPPDTSQNGSGGGGGNNVRRYGGGGNAPMYPL